MQRKKSINVSKAEEYMRSEEGLRERERMVGVGLGVTAAMIGTQFLEVGLNTLIKQANTNGMSNFVFIVYSNFFALFVLAPTTFFYHRFASTQKC